MFVPVMAVLEPMAPASGSIDQAKSKGDRGQPCHFYRSEIIYFNLNCWCPVHSRDRPRKAVPQSCMREIRVEEGSL